jgi:hypothetical protein
VDGTIVAYADSSTSIVAGFAVFSVLANMAVRQTATASAHPELRQSICEQALDVCNFMVDLGGCAICRSQDRWSSPEVGSCCGNVDTHNVAKGGVSFAFSVRLCQLMREISAPFQGAACKSFVSAGTGDERHLPMRSPQLVFHGHRVQMYLIPQS